MLKDSLPLAIQKDTKPISPEMPPKKMLVNTSANFVKIDQCLALIFEFMLKYPHAAQDGKKVDANNCFSAIKRDSGHIKTVITI